MAILIIIDAKTENDSDKIIHRSLPYHLNPPEYPDIKKWINKNKDKYQLFFILCTRDRSISEISRIERFAKTKKQVRLESNKAREIINSILEQEEYPYFIFSYETLVFLKINYLKLVYKFIGIKSDFIPNIYDANKSRMRLRISRIKMIKEIIKRKINNFEKSKD